MRQDARAVTEPALARVFLDRLASDARRAAAADLGLAAQLAASWERAASRWPGVALDARTFIEHLGDKVSATGLALDALEASDLYVARAAAGGDEAAIAAIERSCFGHVDAALSTLRAAEAVREDAKQIVRWEFFVRPAGATSKLMSYDGRGPLRAWLATAAVRTAMRLLRPAHRELPDEGALLAASSQGGEVDWIRSLQGETWKRVVAEAVASLDARCRLLLCQHYVDDLSIDRLGELHGVHRATAARWIEGARRELRKAVTARLRGELKLGRTACESLIRFMMSDLSVTMSALRNAGRGSADR